MSKLQKPARWAGLWNSRAVGASKQWVTFGTGREAHSRAVGAQNNGQHSGTGREAHPRAIGAQAPKVRKSHSPAQRAGLWDPANVSGLKGRDTGCFRAMARLTGMEYPGLTARNLLRVA